MMTFLRNLFGLARAHPLAFVGFLVVVVIGLGGLVWKGLDVALKLVRKVPGVGNKVADAAGGAIKTVADTTGSA